MLLRSTSFSTYIFLMFLLFLNSPSQILLRLSRLCVQEGLSGRKSKKQQQRLLRNMGAHAVVLELLQIPYEKVSMVLNGFIFCFYF